MGDLTLSYPIYDSNQPGYILSPVIINSYTALQLPAYWRGVNFLANNLASFPREIHQQGSPLQVKHPIDVLLKRRPNQYQTAYVFWRQFFFDAVNEGNGFARILRKPAGPIVGLYNMLPDTVTPFRYEGQQYYYDGQAKQVLLYDDVLHLPGLGYDGMIGYNPVILLRETFQRAKDLDQYQSRFLRKGTVLRGSIEIPAGVDEAKAEEIASKLKLLFSGPEAQRDVVVLSDGAKLVNNTITPEASQLMEQTTFSVKQIAQVLGVPPSYLYELGEAKYNNSVEMSGIDVVRYTFRPWLDLIEGEVSLKLLKPAEQDNLTIKLNPNALMRGDATTQTAVNVAQVNAGIRKPNEARADLGLPADTNPESDKLHALGSNAPTAPPPAGATAPPSKHSLPAAGEAFAALMPLLREASGRVDAKSTIAFERKAGRPAPELTVWVNVFSGEQERYATEALAPVAAAVKSIAGAELDVKKIANRYAAALRKRAADGTIRTLTSILEEEINHHGQESDQHRAAA